MKAKTESGAVRRRRPWFSAPGTREPRPMPIPPILRAWARTIRGEISSGRLRDDVALFPGPRNRPHSPEAMLEAEKLALGRFQELGWATQRLPFSATNVAATLDYGDYADSVYPRQEGANLVAVREGEEDTAAVVLLAHLDTVRDSPGADDNTASVAVVLELARVLSGCRFRHSVLFALPDMEEIGFTGARALAAKLLAERPVLGVVCFETMGYTRPEPNTQHLVPGLEVLFPEQLQRVRDRQWRGDFTAVVYNGRATRLAASLAGGLSHFAGRDAFVLLRDPSDLPLIGGLLRRAVPAVRNFARSDHLPFWEARQPALMVTDTANFRYPHYHRPTDTPEKLDYERLADITAAAAVVIACAASLIVE